MSSYAWFDIGNGRQVYRRIAPANSGRSPLACPMVITDAIAPTMSMADGQVYTSKSALRRTYRADGNPQGTEYVELGSEPVSETFRGAPQRDERKMMETIARAEAAVDRGETISV